MEGIEAKADQYQWVCGEPAVGPRKAKVGTADGEFFDGRRSERRKKTKETALARSAVFGQRGNL